MSISQTSYFSQIPNWAFELIPDARIFRFYAHLVSKVNSKTRECWPRQTKIAEEYGVSVSTVSRWMNYLKRIGAVVVRYRWAGDTGRRLTDLLVLPLADPRSPACMSSVDVHTPEVTTTTTSLTTFERVTSGSLRSPDVCEQGKLEGAPVKPNPDQMSLFGEEPCMGMFDSLGSSCKTSKKIKKKVVVEEGRSPVRRILRYWLDGRNRQPSRGVIAGMGKAVKTCLDSGVDEEEIKRAIDALMTTGLDGYPTQLLARFALKKRPKNYKPRDYEKDPLWHRQPQRSTMTAERKIATIPTRFRPESMTASTVETSVLSSALSVTECHPSTTTEKPTFRKIRPPSKERCSYDYEEYDAGTMVRRTRMGRSAGDVLKAMGFGRGN